VEAILNCCLKHIVAMLWYNRKWAVCGGGLEKVPNFGNLRGDRTKESLSLAWIGRTPFPNCQRVSTFREASLTKRGDPVWKRQCAQGRCLSKCPGARRNGGADTGMAVTRTGPWAGAKWGRRLTPAGAGALIQRGGRASSQGLAQCPDCLESGEAGFLPGFGTKC
jgi:hypothetical protein